MRGELRRRWARWRLQGRSVDPRLSTYLDHPVQATRATPVAQVRFVVFDTETTGLDPRGDTMLSLAAVVVRDHVVDLAERFEVTFRGSKVGAASSVVVHQLVPADLHGGAEQEEGVLTFLQFVRGAVLVGHHVGFDVAMVDQVLARWPPTRLFNPTLDTASLYHRLQGSPVRTGLEARPEARDLDALCTRFGLDTPMRHSAAGDALATAQLLLALLDRAERRGIRTLGALLRG